MPYNAKTDWKFDEIVTEHDMNRLEQGIKDAHTEGIDSPEPTTLNLKYGTQVVQSDRIAPYNVMGFNGRTLVNLMGRDGNFETYLTLVGSGAAAAYDTSNKNHGNQSMKIVATGTGVIEHYVDITKQYNLPNVNGYYIACASIKPVAGKACIRFYDGSSQIGFDTGIAATSIASDPNKFTTTWVRFGVSNVSSVIARMHLLKSDGSNFFVQSGESAYFDGISIYEISAADYTAIDSMTVEQIAAKYPYVDDMKPIVNPYVMKYGENLLPPFAEGWFVTAGSGNPRMTINLLYSASLVADGNSQAIAIDIPIAPNQDYTLSVATGRIGVNTLDKNGELINAFGGYSSAPKSFKTDANAAILRVLLSNDTSGAGTYTFTNPMLNLGNTAKLFKPSEDNYLLFPNQWCSNIDSSVADQLYRSGADYYKLAKHKYLTLDGSQNWSTSTSKTGYKYVVLGMPNSSDYTNSIAVKFDGKIIPLGDPNTGADVQNTSFGKFFISISNLDSGWGDGYEPSQAEVQAYFYGWRMFNYDSSNGSSLYTTGTKGWCYREDSTQLGNAAGYIGGQNTLPYSQAPNGNNFKWTPYKLQYQLAQPVLEKIIPEGDITLHEGLNQIEVGDGMIVREKATPSFYSNTGEWLLNNLAFPSSLFKNRVGKLFELYRDDVIDKSLKKLDWDINRYGNFSFAIDRPNYDPSASYTVTYLALDRYSLTCNIQAMQGRYVTNLKTNVDMLTRNQANIIKRVSELENTKAKKIQPQLIVPTLLNGWSLHRGGYYKDDFGIVHVDMGITGGVAAEGTIIMQFPKGYAPADDILTDIFASTQGNVIASTIVDGKIAITSRKIYLYKGANGYMHLLFSFRAEQ
ncbi:hypothetical protein [Paenibacillus sp. RC67]|uniref:hypothetical protein n=1 Tax=Paenibacillus sp. RC67 TaxID=3039392 RepID=UPI0024ACE780|nr:hypothetical protein [Paenibacillus sp. RC67]